MCGFEVRDHTAQVIKDDVFHIECAECIEQDLSMLPIPETMPVEDEMFVMAVQVADRHTIAAYSDYSLEPGETWLLWDTGADSLLCRQGLAQRGTLTSQRGPRLTDVQNNPIKDFGVVKLEYHCENTEGSEIKCETDFQVAEVNENVMSAGKVIRRNSFRAVLDSEGSYLELKTNPGVRVPLYLRRNSFYFKARVRTSDTGEPLLVAPVGQSQGDAPDQPPGDAEEVRAGEQAPMEMEGLAPEGVQPHLEGPLLAEAPPRAVAGGDAIASQELGREWWPAGLHPDSGVENMRHWLRSHYHPVYGTKQQLWQRVLIKNKHKLEQEAIQLELSRQLEERRQGAPHMPAVPAKVPEAPTAAERAEHELTHAKFAAWCEYCILGKGTEFTHKSRGRRDIDRLGPECELDFAHMKTDGSYYTKGEEIDFNDVWCTHLVGIDRGVGSMLCTSVDLSTKGDDKQPTEYVTKTVLNWLKKKSYVPEGHPQDRW